MIIQILSIFTNSNTLFFIFFISAFSYASLFLCSNYISYFAEKSDSDYVNDPFISSFYLIFYFYFYMEGWRSCYVTFVLTVSVFGLVTQFLHYLHFFTKGFFVLSSETCTLAHFIGIVCSYPFLIIF